MLQRKKLLEKEEIKMKFNDIKQKNENKIKEIEKQMEEAEDKNILNTKLESI